MSDINRLRKLAGLEILTESMDESINDHSAPANTADDTKPYPNGAASFKSGRSAKNRYVQARHGDNPLQNAKQLDENEGVLYKALKTKRTTENGQVIYVGMYRASENDGWKRVKNDSGNVINYKTHKAALDAAKYTVENTAQIDEVVERAIPANSEEVTRDDAPGAIVYFYDTPKGPAARAFSGRRGKPDFSYYYSSTEARDKAVQKYFDNVAEKAKYKAERQAKPRGVDVGDIMVGSWGYEQTNVDFYQVVAVAGKNTTVLRKIDQQVDVSKSRGDMTEYVLPVKDSFKGPEIRVRVSDGTAKIGYAYVSKWDGRSYYQSHYA